MRVLYQFVTIAFALVTLASLAIDSFFHPSAMLKHVGIDANLILLLFVVYSIAKKLHDNRYLHPKIVFVTYKFLFPISLIMFLLFAVFENLYYETYALQIFRVHFEEFLLIPIFFGLIIYFSKNVNDYSTIQKTLYFLAPLFIVFMIIVDITNPDLRHTLTQEDGPFEVLQFLFFLLSAFFSFIKAKRLFTNQKILAALWLIFGLGMLFVAIEEISWGQRILNIETPETLRNINYQDETTIHNIGFFQTYIYIPYILIAIWGMVGRKFLPSFSPGSHLTIYFAAVGLYYFTSEFMFFYYNIGNAERTSVMRWQEVTELLLSFGILAFAYEALSLRLSRGSKMDFSKSSPLSN